MFVKSATMSGFTTSGFLPFVPGVPTSVILWATLLSQNRARLSVELNQNFLAEQQASRTSGCFVFCWFGAMCEFGFTVLRGCAFTVLGSCHFTVFSYYVNMILHFPF